jgi:hypothetical protein
MSGLGAFLSNLNVRVLTDADFDEITGTVTTTAASLEDITGLTVDVTIPAGIPNTAAIIAIMVVQCSASSSGATGGWAVNIDSADKQVLARYLASGGSDTGVMMVMGRTTGLSADQTITVKGRHYRVGGSGTVNTDVAQLIVLVVME